MYKKILIATDGSELAGQAVDHGLALAESVGAHVVIATVTEIWSALSIAVEFEKGDLQAIKTYENAAARTAQEILEQAAKKATSAGVSFETRHVSDQKPAKGILETAESEGCDLIVMASHGRRGIQRMLIGSQTAEVVALSTCPVLVVH